MVSKDFDDRYAGSIAVSVWMILMVAAFGIAIVFFNARLNRIEKQLKLPPCNVTVDGRGCR